MPRSMSRRASPGELCITHSTLIHPSQPSFNPHSALIQHNASLPRGLNGGSPSGDLIENANTAFALRVINRSSDGHGSEEPLALLDKSASYTPGKRHQSKCAAQCWRFIDSDMWYQEDEVNLLLQAVEENSCMPLRSLSVVHYSNSFLHDVSNVHS